MRLIVFVLLFVEYLRLKHQDQNEGADSMLPEYAAAPSEQG
jgi:hypothetical protein